MHNKNTKTTLYKLHTTDIQQCNTDPPKLQQGQ